MGSSTCSHPNSASTATPSPPHDVGHRHRRGRSRAGRRPDRAAAAESVRPTGPAASAAGDQSRPRSGPRSGRPCGRPPDDLSRSRGREERRADLGVSRSTRTYVQRSGAGGAGGSAVDAVAPGKRTCAEAIQRRASGTPSDAAPATRGSGAALPTGMQAKMEDAFDVDFGFGPVRVHEGERASSMGALAARVPAVALAAVVGPAHHEPTATVTARQREDIELVRLSRMVYRGWSIADGLSRMVENLTAISGPMVRRRRPQARGQDPHERPRLQRQRRPRRLPSRA